MSALESIPVFGAAPPLVLPNLNLDFAIAAERYSSWALRWLEPRAEALGLVGVPDPLKAYLDRLVPDGLSSTLIVANATRNGQLLLQIRPPFDGPAARRLVVGENAPAFYLSLSPDSNRLVAVSFAAVPHVPPRPYETVVSVRVTRDRRGPWLPAMELAPFLALPEHCKQVEGRLASWRAYLGWRERVLRLGQWGLRYTEVSIIENETLSFHLESDCRASEESLEKLLDEELSAVPLATSGDEQRWEATGKRPEQLLPLGPVVDLRPDDLGGFFVFTRPDRQTLDRIRERSAADEKLSEGVRAARDRCARTFLPREGYLLPSLARELATLRHQENGLDRLQQGQSHAPRLADYLFDISQAHRPGSCTPSILEWEGWRRLDPDQQAAVTKILAAPELSLIQGPPGTGKTSVCAEAVYQEVARGGRVLVASQSNLAVDNILSRLPARPELRPLRVTKHPDRVDERFRGWLPESAAATWLGTVREACRGRLDVRSKLVEQQARGERAERELAGLVGQADGARAREELLGRELAQARRALEEALRVRAESERAVSTLRLRGQGLDELGQWLTDPDAAAPPTQSFLTTAGDRRSWTVADLEELRLSLRDPHGPDEHATGTSQSVVQALRGATQLAAAARCLLGPIEEATHLSQGRDGLPVSSEMADRLESLVREKARLADTEHEAELRRLGTINKELRELRDDRWCRVGRELQRYASVLLGAPLPDGVDEIVAAPRPHAGLLPELRQLESRVVLCLRELDELLAESRPRCLDRVLEAQRRCRDELQARETELQHRQETLATLTERRDELDEQLAECVDRARKLTASWQRAWQGSGIPVMLAVAGTSPADRARNTQQASADPAGGPTELGLASWQHAWHQWQATHASELQRHDRWSSLQREWLDRLQNPTPSDHKRTGEIYARHPNVLGMTCHEAGRKEFLEDPDFTVFDLVIVDEVSKATPTELLLPMLTGHRTALVGDHHQLPPMFRERCQSFEEAIEAGVLRAEDFETYRRMVTACLFAELFDAAPDALRHTLRRQYRFHPQIMGAVNEFYGRRLVAGEIPLPGGLAAQRSHGLTLTDPHGGFLLEPDQHLLWIDSGRDERGEPVKELQDGTSKANPLEVQILVELLSRLDATLQGQGYRGVLEVQAGADDLGLPVERWVESLLAPVRPGLVQGLFNDGRVRWEDRAARLQEPVRPGVTLRVDARRTVGAISFYGAQIRMLREEFTRTQRACGQWQALDLSCNTVDLFQGLECSIVLVSLVRSMPHGQPGEFVRAFQRINVALSRARDLLVVVGAQPTFTRALVSLPGPDGKPMSPEPVYRRILDIAHHEGGLRHASSVLG